MNENTLDPLARASETPDISALQAEFQRALDDGPGTAGDIKAAEATRYNWREGKSHDGLLHQKNLAAGKTVRPYDHRPDCDIPLADETVNAQVDLDMVALANARVKTSATHATLLTAKQVGQIAALINWMRKGPLAKDLIDDGELLSQMKNTNGWAVLHPCWKTRWGLRREAISMAAIEQMAADPKMAETPLAQLPMMIMDPTLEEAAVEVAREFYPYLKPKTARRIVRELRDTGETEFLYREQQENGPSLKVYIPGINFFCAAETGKLARSRILITLENYSQAELEAMEVSDGWDPEFIAAAIATAGLSSVHETALDDKAQRNIEILTAYVRSVDEDGVPGIYCTVFSNHIGKGKSGNAVERVPTDLFAKHFLLDYAHGEYPFIGFRTEVVGLRPNDARGIPQILNTDQMAMKRIQDGVLMDIELSTPPPLKRTGPSMGAIPDVVTPGGIINARPGVNYEALNLTQHSKPDVALKMSELISKRRNDYFCLPSMNAESHPARWQAGQSRKALRWLMPWGQAFWQLAVLCRDEYSDDELAAILGTRPLFTTDHLLKYQVQLQFDIRTLDNDWVIELVKAVAQFVLPFDRSGTIDLAKFTTWVLSSFDPALNDEVTLDQAGAAQAVLNEVRQEVAWIMGGNEANYTQNDATAGMKLQYLQQILANNPIYQAELLPVDPRTGQQNPQFNPIKFQRMKKYEENLQHSVQELQISPTQGKLGITPGGMESGPMQVLPEA